MKLLKPMYRTLLLLLLVLIPLGGCARGPLLLSWDDEVRLGNESAPEFLKQGGGELPDSAVLNYVKAMGTKLAGSAEQLTPDDRRPELNWEFHVLDSQVINAFALPGGKVFVSRGLMERLNNEAQLAGVLGHEIGHVTARHGNQRMSQAMILQGLVLAAGVAGAVSDDEWMQVLGVGTAVGGQLFLLKYSRDNESEADQLGVQYMAQIGYNPVGQVQVMEVLKAASSGGGGPEWLATHPAPDTRIKDLEELIIEKYPMYRDPAHYRMGNKEYEQKVLAPLKALPPAAHGASAFIGPDDIQRIAGMTWEQALHRGCGCNAAHE